jgi:release factor glutamine methyltransferase
VQALRAAGCVFAEEEARLLRISYGGEALAAAVQRRVVGEPLEHILGWVDFAGLRIAVDPGVFVPRRRSELLASVATQLTGAGDVVVDLCCGTGALAAAVAAARPLADVYAADVDARAVACARRNLDPTHVFLADLFTGLASQLRGQIDVLVVNAPYVPTSELGFLPGEARDFEPRQALDGGHDGLQVHRRVAASARHWLAPGGRTAIEVAEHQLDAAVALLRGAGFTTTLHHDDEIAAHVVSGRRPESPPSGAARQRPPAVAS